MNYCKDCEGSALLVVILFMSILSFFCFSFWYNSLLLHDLSLKYLEYEQKYRVAQGGLSYAINICKKNFDLIIKECKTDNQHYQLEIQPCSISENIAYKNNIDITSLDNVLHIRSVVSNTDQKNIFCISCNLQNIEKRFFIKNWRVHEK